MPQCPSTLQLLISRGHLRCMCPQSGCHLYINDRAGFRQPQSLAACHVLRQRVAVGATKLQAAYGAVQVVSALPSASAEQVAP
mmetsp:Transcript_16013/g.34000  ORF Transcript_16013/g.34000 Transcript_16013/m.34000 type:complete len:83 (-) Transcript_16013:481-729(-)